MSSTRPAVEIGTYFKSKDGDVHIVSGFEGSFTDELGNKHQLSECQVFFYTQKDIDEMKEKAEQFKTLFRP